MSVTMEDDSDDSDLTEWMKVNNGGILLISDFEGTAPTKHFEEFRKYCRDPNKKVIYLGDVFDSTVTLGDKDCSSDECPNPEKLVSGTCAKDPDADGIRAVNYCALQTIKLLVDNSENCRYVVGNRDLNKIKLIPFFQFKNGKKWWEDGDSYAVIVSNLLQNEPNYDWYIQTEEDVKLFIPFFNGKTWYENKNEKQRNDKKNKYNTHIYERFEYIFGKDGVFGSMSAVISLKSIPDEIFESTKTTITDFIELLNYENKPHKNNIDPIYKKTVRAALVITVFMRMLLSKFEVNANDVGALGALDGYLYQYLLNAKPAYYAEFDKNLYLFAHGGITDDFVKDENKGLAAFIKLPKDDATWTKALEWQSGTNIKSGGGGKIQQSIQNFNKAYMEMLTQFISSVNRDIQKKIKNVKNIWPPQELKQSKLEIWGIAMLTLLQLSALGRNNIINFNVALSPIQMKEPTDENLDDHFLGGDIYNIFGHASASAGYTFGKVEKSQRTYYIDTDYSSTLFKNGISCKEYNENYLLLIFHPQNNSFTLEGTVILDPAKYKSITDLNFIDTPETSPETNKYYIYNNPNPPENLSIEYKNDLNFIIPEVITESTGVFDSIIKKKIEYKYNGIATINNDRDGIAYHVFSSTWKNKKNKDCFILLPSAEGAIETLQLPGSQRRPGYSERQPGSSATHRLLSNRNYEGVGVGEVREVREVGGKRKRKTKKRSKKTKKRSHRKPRKTKRRQLKKTRKN